MRQQNTNQSGLDQIIPPEIKNDEFYSIIVELTRSQQISTVLEIGSSAGGGSTEAFVTGLSQNPNNPQLFCMEVSRPRFEALRDRYTDKPFVHCYNTSSISLKDFPSPQLIEQFYNSVQSGLNNYPLEQILGWLRQDIEYVLNSGLDENGIARIRNENDIAIFDMVLIDGSEFAGKVELDEVYGATWLLLDDINTYKNFENHFRLKQAPAYELMVENRNLRNGYSVFRLKEASLRNKNIKHAKNGELDVKQSENNKPLIIIDAIFFQYRHTGIARVWLSLLNEWSKSDFASSILLLDRQGTTPIIPGIRTRVIPAYDYDETVKDRNMLQVICDEEDATLFVSTYYSAPLTTKSVFYAYDMIPENTPFFDINHPLWQMKHYGIRHASSYIAISHNTAYDIVRFHPAAANKVTVAHCAVDVDHFYPSTLDEIQQFRNQYSIDTPYFLFIGDRTLGYKNPELVFQALHQMVNPLDIQVIFIGGNRELEEKFIAIAPEANVRVLALKDNLLRIAYSGAAALLFPSIYEGFGLPILEAMACGCPVITCQNSSIPEVAGSAAIYVNEFRANELVAAIHNVQQPEIRESLIAMGYRQVKKFSWVTMANTVQKALESALKNKITYHD